jgi:acyl-CoA thioester hydrolase
MSKIHTFPLRIYYEDTDAGGVVFYANYLKFAERGRTEFLRDIGFESSQLFKENGLLFLVKRVEAEYFSPARLDDQLVVKTELLTLKNTSFMMEQNVMRGDTLLCGMKILLVCVGEDGRPARLPDAVRDKLFEKGPKE